LKIHTRSLLLLVFVLATIARLPAEDVRFRWAQARLLHLLGHEREAVEDVLGLFPNQS
jgi:hypothetical protein